MRGGLARDEAEANTDEIGRPAARGAVVLRRRRRAARPRPAWSRRRSTAFGGLDSLVNNAGVRNETDFASWSTSEWREILGATLDGAYLCATPRCRT